MPATKLSRSKLIAALQFGPAVLAAVIGYFIITPRVGLWGIAFTIMAVLLALYWLGVLLLKPASNAARGTSARAAAAVPPVSAGSQPAQPVERERRGVRFERYILIGLCVGVLICSATMVVGVIGLARYQGPGALWALLEVATFVGAALIPLVVACTPNRARGTAWMAVWGVCLAYVVVLALNALRLGLLVEGLTRLALWIVLFVLFIRVRRGMRAQA